jgi:uncharacterized membrane protein
MRGFRAGSLGLMQSVDIWTAWNHVRTVSALAAAASLAIALVMNGAGRLGVKL